MFASANSIARQFTLPVIISFKKVSGQCGASLGAFVVVNDDGWFVTAYHIIDIIQNLQKSHDVHLNLLSERKKIEEDPHLIGHSKKNKLRTMNINNDSIVNYSTMFGFNNASLKIVHAIPAIDLAIGQLINFPKGAVKVFPKFKDPTKPMESGTSLCKLGFPFHSIIPAFDDKTNAFVLPDGSLPVPLFPMEGIYTRTINVNPPVPLSYPLKYIETSSPGLKGQSGGPTFDVKGAIWAIQSSTNSLALDFGDGKKTGKEAEHIKNQYLNVGLGVHSETIIGLFREKSVTFDLTDY